MENPYDDWPNTQSNVIGDEWWGGLPKWNLYQKLYKLQQMFYLILYRYMFNVYTIYHESTSDIQNPKSQNLGLSKTVWDSCVLWSYIKLMTLIHILQPIWDEISILLRLKLSIDPQTRLSTRRTQMSIACKHIPSVFTLPRTIKFHFISFSVICCSRISNFPFESSRYYVSWNEIFLKIHRISTFKRIQ